MMKKSLPILALAALLFSCQKPDDSGSTTPASSAPTAITLTPSATALSVEAEGKAYDLTISAPARPKVEIPADGKAWISLKDGVFKDYKITVTLTIAANTTYDPRTSEITVSATGVPSLKLTVNQEGKEVVVDPTLPDNTAVAMAKKIGFGWNMGNQMEAHNDGNPSETAWTGVLCTQAALDAVAEAGLKSVRIPVTWINLIGPAPDYTLDETRLSRLKEIVGFAHNAGLFTIINIHHDGADSKYWLSVRQGADNDAILDKIGKVWTQLANAFADCDDWLVFESFNEIHDGGWGWSDEYLTAAGKKRQNDILNGWNQKFVDVVRATGGKNATRWLGVPGYCASPEFTLDDGFKVPTDKAGKIMVAVHDYTPYKFAQTAEVNQWGHNRTVELKDPTYGEDYMKELFNRLYTRWVANNIPVYLGEFGCANRTDEKGFAAQLYYLEYMSKCASVFGMGGLIWDNGAKGAGNDVYGIFNHGTGAYMDKDRGPRIVEACLRGYTSTDPTYTLQSVYDSAPQF